jgi:hypothetical protein
MIFRRLILSALFLLPIRAADTLPALRPPAVPLITHDPYFSVWSMSDRLNESPTRHWTGTDQPIAGVIRVDGRPYRFMGGQWRWADPIPPLVQTSREVTPTHTRYSFEGHGIHLDLEFLTPALPDDLDLLSRPVTYLTWRIRSTDNRPHPVQLYFDAPAHLAVNQPSERVEAIAQQFGDLAVLRLGSIAQPVLAKSGDDLRIDWGYLYLTAPSQQGLRLIRTSVRDRLEFLTSGHVRDNASPRALTDRNVPVLAATFDLGSVSAGPVSRHILLAYDDLYSVEYFGRKLRPYWRRGNQTPETLLKEAVQNYASLEATSNSFDRALTEKLLAAGGPKYAVLSILSYRQTLAAHKLVVDADGTLLYFSKENFSNGCIGTVDVTYPSSPFFLALQPKLLEAQLRFIFDYAQMPRWPWPYPPHDIGQYPLANGQVYGGAEETETRQMPVEEAGNMILMTAALARAQHNADFAKRYWPLLTKWAAYLKAKGLDPENQLNTDDFAGHMAHNTNLSLKAILAIGAYAQLAKSLGQPDAATYDTVARRMAADWVKMATDGDHYRLAFDQPGTWSQKYNLVWDRLLGLNLFPAEVARTEIAFYKQKENKYGLPLDNRQEYTKLDWTIWTATMASNRSDFEALVAPVFAFLNESPSRVPETDWYETVSGEQRNFQARSVVGGVYIKLLADQWSR